jgi:sucrose phosphorylase
MNRLQERVLTHLDQIYTDLTAEQRASLAALLMQEMQLSDQDTSAGRQPGHWDESDIYLITYADSILPQDPRPSESAHNDNVCLQSLHAFMNTHLQDSISAVHILPFYPWSSDDGFAVKDYTQVDPRYGDWGHVESIAKDYQLMADLVINHCSASHTWFQNFIDGKSPGKDFFVTASPETDLSAVIRPRTSDLLRETDTVNGKQFVWCTFGHDQIDLNFANPEVLVAMIRIVRQYLDHGVRVFRLDAVAFVWKDIGSNCLNLPQTHEIVRLIRTLVEHAVSDVLLITETNIPKRENLSYFGNANEAHSIYNFSLPPLLIHALITGHSRHLKNWLMSMPPAQMGTFYFNFIASHDGIGLRPAEGLLSDEELERMLTVMDKAGGEISWRASDNLTQRPYEINISLWDAMSRHAEHELEGADQWQHQRFLCAHTILLALEGIPAFYIHSLLATGNDYDRLKASGHKRHINRHRWHAQTLQASLNDPNSRHARILCDLKALIATRRKQPAFHPNATQFTLHLGDAIFAFWRQSLDRKQSIFALNNVSDQIQHVPLSEINLIDTEDWVDLISGKPLDMMTADIVLAPYQSIWLSNLLH